MSQLSTRMYRYRAKREKYHCQRDEARASVQTRGANTSLRVTDPPSVFIQGTLYQGYYYSSIMQTWLIRVPLYTPSRLYLVPPITYVHIDVSIYQELNGAQKIASTQGKVVRLVTSHSHNRIGKASSQHLMGSSKVHRVARAAHPTGSMGTTHPQQGRASNPIYDGVGNS